MESCLKKLILEAGATGFQEPWKAVGSRWDRLGEGIVLGGLDWGQTGLYSQPPGGQKTNSGLYWGPRGVLFAGVVFGAAGMVWMLCIAARTRRPNLASSR